ncbi:hypothetical protein PYV61_09465, partial [Roseisolibacter sp. H3M3-2]
MPRLPRLALAAALAATVPAGAARAQAPADTIDYGRLFAPDRAVDRAWTPAVYLAAAQRLIGGPDAAPANLWHLARAHARGGDHAAACAALVRGVGSYKEAAERAGGGVSVAFIRKWARVHDLPQAIRRQ